MAKKLYVGGLAYATTEGTLEETFSQFGKVDNVFIIKDKFSGKSRGFGFVEMENDDEATTAMTELNGKELDGRTVVVNEAREREQRAPRNKY